MSNCPPLQIKNHDCEPLPPWKGKFIFKTKMDCWSWQILARQVQAWADGDDVWPLLASHVSSWRLPKQLFSFAPLLLFVWDARHDSSIWIFHAIKSAQKRPKRGLCLIVGLFLCIAWVFLICPACIILVRGSDLSRYSCIWKGHILMDKPLICDSHLEQKHIWLNLAFERRKLQACHHNRNTAVWVSHMAMS